MGRRSVSQSVRDLADELAKQLPFYKHGENFFSSPEVAELYGVSVHKAISAFHILRDRGRLTIVSGVGTFVRHEQNRP